MSNLNRVVLQGNLTRDPETRFSAGGLAIVGFGIAVNDMSGEKDKASFIDCTAFGKTGEAIAKFFTKGKQIIIEGRLKQERWDDKQSGQKRSKVVVLLDGFHFSGPKGTSDSKPEEETVPSESAGADATPAAAVAEGDGKLF